MPSPNKLPKPKLYAEGGMCPGAGCPGCSKCMAEGGNVNYSGNPGHSKENIKGVHQDKAGGSGLSPAGAHARSISHYEKKGDSEKAERSQGWSKAEHEKVLGEMKSMKKPNLYAEGGDVMPDMDSDGDHDGDSEVDDGMLEGVAGELMDAFEKKDKAGMLDAIRAIVMSCGREG